MPKMDEAQLATLAAELTNDPGGLGYAGMTDAEAATKISEPGTHSTQGSTVTLPVATGEIVNWLLENDKLSAIIQGADVAATTFVKLVSIPHVAELDPNNAQVVALFQALQGQGYLNGQDLQALARLAVEVGQGPSRADELGLGRVYEVNVTAARGGS